MTRHKKKILLTLLILTITYTITSLYASTNFLKVTSYTYNVHTNKKVKVNETNETNGINGLNETAIKLVVLSDLHDHEFGPGNQKLISKIAKQSPDLILLVGDFLNGDSSNAEVPCTLIRGLKDIAPVYFSLGNHELDYMENQKNVQSNVQSNLIAELEAAGASVLEKEYVDLTIRGQELRLGGMYDYAFAMDDFNTAENLEGEVRTFLEEFQNTDRLKVMMAHRPDSFVFGNAAEYWEIDLVVSGHNHGGQVVVPFLGGLYGGDQGFFPKYIHGMYEKGKMNIFVTSGLGSDEQALPRFNNLPEIAVLTIPGAD